MKLTNISFNQLNFKSGLTSEILSKEMSMNVKSVEEELSNKYFVESCFFDNKSFALANQSCLDIFQRLSAQFKVYLKLPPSIYLYNSNQLLCEDVSANFCIPDTRDVLKNEYPFPGRSIFFRAFKNLDEVNNNTELLYNNKICSSSHFLAPFIHEWLHSFQLDYIFKNFGYGGYCDYLKEIYPNKNTKITGIELLGILKTKKLSPKESEIVGETLGCYSMLPCNQYLEIFSEAFTKFICDSLNGIALIKNPLEQLKKTSTDFQKILKKVCLFE